MSNQPVSLTPPPAGYVDWLAELKGRSTAPSSAPRWRLTASWRCCTATSGATFWRAKVIKRLAHDLRAVFPEMKGFSRASLIDMRAFAQARPDAEIVQQAVGQLPWGHNLVLLTRLKDPQQRLAYAQSAPSRMAGHATCWTFILKAACWSAQVKP